MNILDGGNLMNINREQNITVKYTDTVIPETIVIELLCETLLEMERRVKKGTSDYPKLKINKISRKINTDIAT